MKNPNQHTSSIASGELAIAPHFKVGGPGTFDMLSLAGVRHFYWEPSVTDEHLKHMAGWGKYVDTSKATVTQDCLTLPKTTRTAGAVLSGMQAWPTEKMEVVTFLADYVRRVYDKFGGVDQGLSLDTLGVSRGNEEIFALPPHNLVTDPTEVQQWAERLDHDLVQVLGEEGQRDQLMEKFRNTTGLAPRET